jgi:transglutaminase superfamily protein
VRLLKSTVPFLLHPQTRLTAGKRWRGAALLVEAFWQLVRFDFILRRGDFARLYQTVQNSSLKTDSFDSRIVDEVCGAVDRVCILYWKQVLCLQRSAATVCLLRRFGIPAELVIGAQTLPARAHAWVEVGSCVVNDKPYMREMYEVLDRC